MADRRVRVESDHTPASTGFRSNGLLAGGFLFTAGWIGVPLGPNHKTDMPADTLEEQIHLICSYLEAVTTAAGLSKEDVIEVSAFVADPENEMRVREGIDQYLGFTPPLINYHNVLGVARDGMLELDWIALADRTISREQAVEILKPFGHEQGLVKSGPFVMINGLAAPGESLGDQTYNVMAEAEKILASAGSSFKELCKMNVFYTTPTYPGDYPQFNEATKVLFADFEPPTRSVVRAPKITGEYRLRVDFIALGPDN